jgi:[ribosomal protein S18]-alanine N-acetyltransferase
VRLRVEPLTPEDASVIIAWRYRPPYDTYDVDVGTAHLLDPRHRYHGIWDGDELLGYCCFGVDATMPGGSYDDEQLEIGWGMHPDRMGQGRGSEFVGAIVEHAERHYAPSAMGVTIAQFNERSQRAARSAGFEQETGRFVAPDGMAFVQLRRSPVASG